MTQNLVKGDRIYFRYTPAWDANSRQVKTRATLALKKVGNTLCYGLAICSRHDNFCRKTGREQALERLNRGLGCIDLSGYKAAEVPVLCPECRGTGCDGCRHTGVTLGPESEHQVILKIANSMLESIFLKLEKFKSKIELFNAEKKLKTYKHDPFLKRKKIIKQPEVRHEA